MKIRTFLILGITLILAPLAAEPVMAGGERAVGRYLPELLVLLFALFGKLAGLGAVLGAGIFARDKPVEVKFCAFLVAAIGGIWTAYNWFGLPYKTVHNSLGDVLFRNAPSTSLKFSFGGFILLMCFAVTGALICAAIAKTEGGDGNRNA